MCLPKSEKIDENKIKDIWKEEEAGEGGCGCSVGNLLKWEIRGRGSCSGILKRKLENLEKILILIRKKRRNRTRQEKVAASGTNGELIKKKKSQTPPTFLFSIYGKINKLI